eukprot:scaffold250926_cov39-Tisochrysis_lutea.AAC.1
MLVARERGGGANRKSRMRSGSLFLGALKAESSIMRARHVFVRTMKLRTDSAGRALVAATPALRYSPHSFGPHALNAHRCLGARIRTEDNARRASAAQPHASAPLPWGKSEVRSNMPRARGADADDCDEQSFGKAC